MASLFDSGAKVSDESARPFLSNEDEDAFYAKRYPTQNHSRWRRLLYYLWPLKVMPRRLRRSRRLLFFAFTGLPYFIIALVLLTSLLLPSYTRRPAHYRALSQRCAESNNKPGCANVNNEKVFIAASIYDEEGSLTGGPWGHAMLELVNLLGPDNVFLSVYENDADPKAQKSLDKFQEKVKCNSSIVSEHLPLDKVTHVTAPLGKQVLKRIAFLAEVRNRALRPLDGPNSKSEVAQSLANTVFDKVLFINDIVFHPEDAAQLLLSTNVNEETGRTRYRAACAVDFVNPFKFYDTFATRDLEGYQSGIPFFPWFTSAGHGTSRRDVLNQRDAVRVRSCWGGMAAYEAKWFQELAPEAKSSKKPSEPPAAFSLMEGRSKRPLRFRFEQDTFWDASECCLINADIQYVRSPDAPEAPSGVYINPYIRVAYDTKTLSWLGLTRRPERLYSLVHNILNHIVGMPGENPRRKHEPGDSVKEMVWRPEKSQPDGGKFRSVTRVADPGRYCGSRKLLAINEDPQEGDGRWLRVAIPGCEQDGGGCIISHS